MNPVIQLSKSLRLSLSVFSPPPLSLARLFFRLASSALWRASTLGENLISSAGDHTDIFVTHVARTLATAPDAVRWAPRIFSLQHCACMLSEIWTALHSRGGFGTALCGDIFLFPLTKPLSFTYSTFLLSPPLPSYIHTHFLVASFLRTSFSVPTVPSRNIDFRPSLGACESTALNLGIFMWRRLYGDSRSSWDLSTGLWNDISLPELRTNYAIAVSFYSCSTSLPLPSTHTPSPVDILHSFFGP